MAEVKSSVHGQWSGRWAFILAATGSAVGLGNIWKFPYITGQNGGGAFVVVYLVCILIIGLPVMMGEVMMGRRGRLSPVNTLRALADEAGASRAWIGLGWLGMITTALILTFYAVIAGWSLAYILYSAQGMFTDASADEVGRVFSDFTASPWRLMGWTTAVVVITLTIVGRGVEKGLESAVRYMMPGLLVLLLVMVGYAMNSGSFMDAVDFLFRPDFSKLTRSGVLVALGHACFTLSLGAGAMVIYGAYLPDDVSIARTSIIVAVADTVVALLAGLAIFPVVFANGLEPGAGPGLIFVTLPIAFGQMPYGAFFGTLFFVMLSMAALTSAISIIEPMVAWLVERAGLTRVRAATFAGLGVWVIGLGTIFSFNIWEDVKLWDKTFFDLLDFLTTNIMLPLAALLVAVFTSWIMHSNSTREELALHEGQAFYVWRFTMRYVAPVAILVVFLNLIGVINL